MYHVRVVGLCGKFEHTTGRASAPRRRFVDERPLYIRRNATA